ncbi:MAG: hypothetical protein L6R38_005184 [Xanthoria sp. 2 TBL-2021]|nr:MAG: hypothetical protein L6R38_005184 [Xanthoria sp. 2 TBL-2021]
MPSRPRTNRNTTSVSFGMDGTMGCVMNLTTKTFSYAFPYTVNNHHPQGKICQTSYLRFSDGQLELSGLLALMNHQSELARSQAKTWKACSQFARNLSVLKPKMKGWEAELEDIHRNAIKKLHDHD